MHSFNTRTETHVKLPHLDGQGLRKRGDRSTKVNRWQTVQQELGYLKELLFRKASGKDLNKDERRMSTSKTIQNCISAYNPGIDCNFRILQEVYQAGDFEVDVDGNLLSLDYTTSFIVHAALALPELFPEPLELLGGNQEYQSLELSKDQLCCILANAFFCTFPDREFIAGGHQDLPRINFTALFDDQDNKGPGWKARLRQTKLEKLKCFLNYFARMSLRFGKDEGYPSVIFERRRLQPNQIPDWARVQETFLDLGVHEQGTIEDSVGSLHVEFANKFVGGGTIGSGAAMEEIRFSCCPELVASQLFTKELGNKDVLLVHKYEEFNSHTGYGGTFKFDGNFLDDIVHINDSHVVALDAYHFPRNATQIQFERKWIDRELNKCLAGFHSPSSKAPSLQDDCPTVASGKWGCGVFNGHPLLKCIIQWMVTSYCQKSLDLYTFGDSELSSDLIKLKKLLDNRRDVTIGRAYSIILKYGEVPNQSENLLQFVENALPVSVKETKETKEEKCLFRQRYHICNVCWIIMPIIAILIYLNWTLPVKILKALLAVLRRFLQ